MRVLHITSNLKGGAGRAALRLHKALLKMDIESHILILSQSINVDENVNIHFFRPELSIFEKVYNKFKYPASFWSKRRRFLNEFPIQYQKFSFLSQPYNKGGKKFISSFDIINLHWISDFFDFSYLFNALKGKNVFWTIHDMNVFTGGCHYSALCELYKKNCFPCHQIDKTSLPKLATEQLYEKHRILARHSINFIALSNWMKDSLTQSKIYKKDRVELIPNSIDTEIFASVNSEGFNDEISSMYKGKTVLLTVSEKVSDIRKGFSILIEALGYLDQEKYFLLIAGEIPPNSMIPIPHYSFGFINSERELAEIYNRADLFLLPSLEDNLPNVALESISCGVPIVAFDTGGLPDIINDTNGLLIKDISAKTFANGIKEASLIRFNPEKVRKAAISKYNWKNQAESYLHYYKSVLNI